MTEMRADVIRQALKSYHADGGTRRETVTWRNQEHNLEVVPLPTVALLLNPLNHRFTAQLEDHPQSALVREHPESAEAQEVIASLLRGTEEFTKLRDELKDQRQLQPGLVTREGMLINGNTRAVALRDLSVAAMLVAVLPEGVLAAELMDLEVELQLLRLRHQDYTYTNMLLLTRKQVIERGVPVEEFARRISTTKKKVEQRLRVLAMIEEIRSAHSLPWTWFDDKQQVLEELDKTRQELLDDPVAYSEVTNARISAMLVGITKLDVREVDESFIEKAVLPRLDDELADLVRRELAEDDLPSDIADLVSEDDSQQLNIGKLRELLIGDPTEYILDGSITREDFRGSLSEAIRLGAERSRSQRRTSEALRAPVQELRESRLSMEAIVDQYSEIRNRPGFKQGEFEYELQKAHQALRRLEEISGSDRDT